MEGKIESLFGESNAGSVTQLVTSEQPLAIAPAVHKPLDDTQIQYKSHPDLNPQSDFLYKPLRNKSTDTLSKAHSFSDNLHIQQQNNVLETKVNLDDLHLDSVVLPDNYKVVFVNNDKHNNAKPSTVGGVKYDNDLTLQEKENNLLSATRLRLLQDTTMIESALDLDSLDDSSLGTSSQAGLMKVGV